MLTSATLMREAAAGDLLARQVAIMVPLTKRSFIVVALGLALIALLFVPLAGWPRFLLWAGAILAALTLRTATLAYIFRRQTSANPLRQAERAIMLTTGLLGLCVASGAFVYYPVADFPTRALITLILCAWPAGGLGVLGVHPRSFLVYLTLYYAVLCSAWWIYEPHLRAVSALMVLFATTIGLLSLQIGSLIAQTVTLAHEKDVLLSDKDALLVEKDALIGELETARSQAQEASQYKSRFLAAASHDLRQPVTALSLLAGTLGESNVDPKVRTLAQQIVRGLTALESLFTAILDLSKLEAGAVQITPTTFDLTELYAELESEFKPRFAARGIEFDVAPHSLWVVTDRVHLERILRNLLDNALKYTARGRVALTTERCDSGIALVVTDTGPGIAPVEHERIFSDFHQLGVRTSRSRHAGLGLGLAIVRRLAHALGITIGVRSDVGQGAAFSVALPQSMLAVRPTPAASCDAARAVDLAGSTIAIIDNDDDVRSAFGLAIDQWGAHPIVARDGGEALARVAATGRTPDVVIADYHLANGERGTDVIAAFRKAYRNVPALLMTGDGDVELLEMYGLEVVRKPVPYAALRARIAGLLAARQRHA
ncbi:MAG: response regulator [Burkholderiales bacterium]|nr:response regulator [Burkholderiales bacterium]